MYCWLLRRLPKILVDTAFVLWYAALIVLVVYFSDRPGASFLYLHG
ncbi:MAG: hypothetical protein ACT4PZ_19910 [Panacagrimonas sp.]